MTINQFIMLQSHEVNSGQSKYGIVMIVNPAMIK